MNPARWTPGNFILRCLSALVLGPLVLGIAFLGGPVAGLLAAGTAGLAAHEWVRLAAPEQEGCTAAGAAVLAVAIGLLAPSLGYPLAIGLALAVAMLQRLSALAALGIAYAGVFGAALAQLAAQGGAALPWLLAVVWTADIGAYALGRLFRGPRLAPTISPGKTWMGMLGAILGGSLAGACAIALGAQFRTPVFGLLAGALLGFFGQCGDLVESALKRHAGAKDSGTLIPGHGGMLDRVDALMTCAPVLVFLLSP